jgi:hypothetical protein
MEVKVHINNVDKQNYMVNYIKRKTIWSIKYKFLNKTIYMVNSYKVSIINLILQYFVGRVMSSYN